MIYDVHCHPQWANGPERLRGGTFPSPEGVKAVYDRLGITAGLIMPLEANEHSHDPITNRVAADIQRAYPSVFAGRFCYVDPRMMNNRSGADLSYYLRFYRDRGAVGLGETQAHLPLTDDRLRTLCACAAACAMPMTVHFARAGEGFGVIVSPGLPELDETLRACPELILIAHANGFWRELSGGTVAALMDRYPRLHADLAGGAALRALTKDPAVGYAFLNAYADRILYGTDLSSKESEDNAAAMLGFLQSGKESGALSQGAYHKIASDNAKRLFGLPDAVL